MSLGVSSLQTAQLTWPSSSFTVSFQKFQEQEHCVLLGKIWESDSMMMQCIDVDNIDQIQIFLYNEKCIRIHKERLFWFDLPRTFFKGSLKT